MQLEYCFYCSNSTKFRMSSSASYVYNNTLAMLCNVGRLHGCQPQRALTPYTCHFFPSTRCSLLSHVQQHNLLPIFSINIVRTPTGCPGHELATSFQQMTRCAISCRTRKETTIHAYVIPLTTCAPLSRLTRYSPSVVSYTRCRNHE